MTSSRTSTVSSSVPGPVSFDDRLQDRNDFKDSSSVQGSVWVRHQIQDRYAFMIDSRTGMVL